ncbi:bacteriohemerythrin [Magnetococcus sp. PR-3]|uniref:bacteriohemerythrin n=1 Tax=Magnetococcus sp. PR-3 TaxID=3120355 RepID=UPI002FCE1B42
MNQAGEVFRSKLAETLPDVGVARFNDAHQKLVDIIIDIDQILEGMIESELAQDSWNSLGDLIGSLVLYTRQHFEDEEKAMRANDYLGYIEHSQQHVKLVGELQVFQNGVVSQNEEITMKMRSWLLEWLLVHIKSFDMQYRPVLEGKV